MLDFIRTHKRWTLILLVLFIVPGLGFVGIQGLHGLFDKSANIASVAGSKITLKEYEAALQAQLQQLRQVYGAKAISETAEIRTALLDALIKQRMVEAEIQRRNLTASDAAVRRAILGIPAIAALRKPDGEIDTNQYRQLLAAQNITPEQLDVRVRQSLAIMQLNDSIGLSAFAPDILATQINNLLGQKWQVREQIFPSSSYTTKILPAQLDDTHLKQYYDTHQDQFARPEAATIEYVVLSAAKYAQSIQPSDAELQAYYQSNLARYRIGKQIKARHILIAVPENASTAQKTEANEKARALLKQLQAQPDQFSELARKNSQDPGSAVNGGDLGYYFGTGMMDKAFETAAFKLKKNEISDIVQSDFGYHIIQVTDIKPETVRPLSEVKARLTAEFKKQQAEQYFAKVSEQFSNLVDEQHNNLQPIADKLNLPVQTAVVSRTPDPAVAPTVPWNHPQFLTAVFNDEVLKQKRNTGAIEVGEQSLIAARITHYRPASVQPFSEARQNITQKVIAVQSAVLARQAGEAQLAVLEKEKNTADVAAGFSPAVAVSRMQTQGLPQKTLAAIFKTEGSTLPRYIGVALDDGYAIYRIDSVDAAPQDEKNIASLKQQLTQLASQVETKAYFDALRARSKVKIYHTPEQNTEQ
jgi:peptidyl-prolyl cis-trans isomerase D